MKVIVSDAKGQVSAATRLSLFQTKQVLLHCNNDLWTSSHCRLDMLAFSSLFRVGKTLRVTSRSFLPNVVGGITSSKSQSRTRRFAVEPNYLAYKRDFRKLQLPTGLLRTPSILEPQQLSNRVRDPVSGSTSLLSPTISASQEYIGTGTGTDGLSLHSDTCFLRVNGMPSSFCSTNPIQVPTFSISLPNAFYHKVHDVFCLLDQRSLALSQLGLAQQKVL